MNKNIYRIMPGPKSIYAEEVYKGNFIGADFGLDVDLTNNLPENWREFNKEFIPIYLNKFPDKNRIVAGLACGNLHTICKGMVVGDLILVPDGQGNYYVGEVTSDYHYEKGEVLPHRRNVQWYSRTIARNDMSQSLRYSTGSIGTVANISQYAQEIQNLISRSEPLGIKATDESIEDLSTFALEKHLEDFLIQNWKQTELGKKYDIYEEEGQVIGQQYPSDTGPIDILAISKDKKELLVVELKRGRISDIVVGQIQRYMGFVKEELANSNQTVRGVIIALEDDIRIHRALSVVDNIEFYTYQINFKLNKKK